MFQIKRLRLFKGLILPIGMLLLVILFGAFGYMLVEGFGFLQSLYLSVIIISTVGLGEAKVLTDNGHIFTIILVLLNMGLFTYFITLLTRFFSDGEFEKQYNRLKM
jgi:voltage-gated potassium channel